MNKNLGNTFGAAKVGACLAGMLVFASNSYGSNEAVVAAQFEVHIMENTTGGREILAGDYSAAIEKILFSPSLDSKYVKDANLCAVYTVQKEFNRAEAHCMAALDASKSRNFGTGMQGISWERGANRVKWAMALNNLGVLHALKGNNGEARDYFQSASKKSHRLRATSDRNIHALEGRMGTEVASS